MGLVAAKCTQCGANIEVDDTKEAGICKYCGTAFITEKAITNYNAYITNNNNFAGANINIVGGDIENLLELARNSLEINNEKETLKYCEKALEIDVKNSDAWFIKMQAEKIRVVKAEKSIENAKSIEAISVAGNNSIKYTPDYQKESRTREVHSFYLESTSSFLSSMKISVEYDDVDTLKALAKINKNNALARDQMYLLGITSQELFALKLLDGISIDEITTDSELQEKYIECINLYVDFRNQYRIRSLIYSGGPNADAVATMKKKYEELTNRLPDDKRDRVKAWTMVGAVSETKSDNASSSNNACYIATCVYGSYDCPQVWTLRRFRDYTLDETWYGRLFIKCYYAISPTLVKWFGGTRWFRHFWKSILDKIVKSLNSKGIENRIYMDKY